MKRVGGGICLVNGIHVSFDGRCERTRGRAASIIFMAVEEADVGRRQPLRRRRLTCVSLRGGGRKNKRARTAMFGIQHDHVMSEFQRTWS